MAASIPSGNAGQQRAEAVLVADDDVDVLEVMSDIIQQSGRLVFTAGDGARALELLDATVPRPCLVLLDWMMPVMGGDEFLARLSTRPDAAKFPVLVMSAQRPVGPWEKSPLVVGVMPKPFDIDALLGALDRFC